MINCLYGSQCLLTVESSRHQQSHNPGTLRSQLRATAWHSSKETGYMDWKTQKARQNPKRWDRLSTDDQYIWIYIIHYNTIGYYRPIGSEDLVRLVKQGPRGWERGEIKWRMINSPSWDQWNSSILIVNLLLERSGKWIFAPKICYDLLRPKEQIAKSPKPVQNVQNQNAQARHLQQDAARLF